MFRLLYWGALILIHSESSTSISPHCLTCTGQLHIQMTGESDESSAILSPFEVPLREWCHVSLMLHGRMVSSALLTENMCK